MLPGQVEELEALDEKNETLRISYTTFGEQEDALLKWGAEGGAKREGGEVRML